MWKLLLMLCVLDQNQAAPLPWEHGSLQPFLQQLDQSAPSPSPDGQQRTSSSSSSSSSSVSSESSQSSEGPQQLRERQNLENLENLENTAVEQMESSLESSELSLSPTNSELVLLGQTAGEWDTQRGSGDAGADITESRHQALLLTGHHLLSPPPPRGQDAAAEGGGATAEAGGAEGKVGVALGEEGVVRGEEFHRPSEISTETADGPGHAHRSGYHGHEAGLELGL